MSFKRIEYDPEEAHPENIGEFFPEAVDAVTELLRHMKDFDLERDAGLVAATVLAGGLHAMPEAK